MSTELVRKFRKQIPQGHRESSDTRIAWLWNQRFGTIQTIWNETVDPLDKMACTLFLQAILSRDLSSIETIFRRIEGSILPDDQVIDKIRV